MGDLEEIKRHKGGGRKMVNQGTPLLWVIFDNLNGGGQKGVILMKLGGHLGKNKYIHEPNCVLERDQRPKLN